MGLENFKRLLQDSSIPQIAWNVSTLAVIFSSSSCMLQSFLLAMVSRIGNKYLKYICRTAIYFPPLPQLLQFLYCVGILLIKI